MSTAEILWFWTSVAQSRTTPDQKCQDMFVYTSSLSHLVKTSLHEIAWRSPTELTAALPLAISYFVSLATHQRRQQKKPSQSTTWLLTCIQVKTCLHTFVVAIQVLASLKTLTRLSCAWRHLSGHLENELLLNLMSHLILPVGEWTNFDGVLLIIWQASKHQQSRKLMSRLSLQARNGMFQSGWLSHGKLRSFSSTS